MSKYLPSIDDAKDLLKTRPMPFQVKAAKRLKEILKSNSRAFLADEPGLGKTFSSTKLICDMAMDYWSKSENANSPFYVIYIAPNKELLRQNKDEIIRKANAYVEDNGLGFKIIDVADYISKEAVFYSTIEKALIYRIKRKLEKNNSNDQIQIFDSVNNLIKNELREIDFEKLTTWGPKHLIENLRKKYKETTTREYIPTWDEYKAFRNEFETPDRPAYIHDILKHVKKKKGIHVLTISAGVLFGNEIIPPKEKEIIGNAGCKTRDEFISKFVTGYHIQLVLWDEYHRYATKLKKTNAFFEVEGTKDGDLRNLFISATPYKTNVSKDDVIKELYENAADDEEEMSTLPGFDEFAHLFCHKLSIDGKIYSENELCVLYKKFNENPSDNKDEMQKVLLTRMVRHERSRLQKQHEEHIRKYLPENNYYVEYTQIFKNTYKQCKRLEQAGYKPGAQKWSLSLPWLLSFSTDRGKVEKEENGNPVSTYFELLKPNANNQLSKFLFAYNDDGSVKDCIAELPEQDLAFHEICEENVKDRMRQLLWVPPTMPLYSSGEKSIFSEYSNYSKLLVFAEYRYLQRGGSRLLSDYVKYENTDPDNSMPDSFPEALTLSSDNGRLNRLVSFDFLGEDYREFSVDDLIKRIIETYGWEDIDCYASVAAPAVCAKRLNLDPKEIEDAFNIYIQGEGKKQALWSWLCDNGYRDKDKWEEGIYRYCAEGNLYSVLEEWMFIMKTEDNKADNKKIIEKQQDKICDCLSYSGSTVHVQTHKSTQNREDGFAGKCSFAEQLTNDFSDNGGFADDEKQMETSAAFSSPFWPMVLFAGRGAQEGIDMHEYSLRIMHLTMPRGAVSYEQRNGRIDRFRSLLVRRRVAEYFSEYNVNADTDGMASLIARSFAQAIREKDKLNPDNDQLFPNWHFDVMEESIHHFEELIPIWDHTDESCFVIALDEMLRSYRGSMGLSADMEDFDKGIDLSAQ